MIRFLLNKISFKKYIIFIFIIIQNIVIGQPKVDGYSGATWKNVEKLDGSISGKVINAITNKSISYANISIKDKITKKVIEGTVTSEKGKFLLNGLDAGTYILSISFLGYENKEIEFEITKKDLNIKLKNIRLKQSINQISEIEINETKAIYENKIDKIVYNPENDINQSSEDATDVLRKTPLLSVDLDGNVSIRGSSNIKFLVNGKESSFLTNDISSALQMIPADQIKSIEVITSPGAKYDGEGDAGIVNIITKKKIIDGYKGTLNGSIGKVNRQSLNITLGKGKIGLSARGGIYGMYWPRIGELEYVRKDWDEIINGDTLNQNILKRNGQTLSRWTGYRSNIDFFYELDPLTIINSSFTFGGRNKFSDDETEIIYEGDTSYDDTSFNLTKSISNNLEWTTDFTKSFSGNNEREISIALQISKDFDDETSKIDEFSNIIENYSNGIGTTKTFQLDYVHPFGNQKSNKKNIYNSLSEDQKSRFKNLKNRKNTSSIGNSNKIEIGLKYIDRNNQFNYYTEINEQQIDLEETFIYDQRVASAYLSSQFYLPKDIGLVIGGRYELTDINGRWENNTNPKFNRKPYGNFLPNIVLSKKISMAKSIKISFNRRISRPGSYYVNPNIGRSDNNNLTIGNPYLVPAVTNQIELGYNSFNPIFQSSYYIYLKNTDSIVESIVSIMGDTSVTEYYNIGNNSKIGFNYYGSINLKTINIRGGFNIYRFYSEDQRLGSLRAILYNYNFGGTVKLPRRFKIETWGWFSTPTQTIQGTTDSWSMMSIGFKKDFKNKRGSIGLRIVEPFTKYKDRESNINGDNFSLYTNRRMNIRSIGISFNYTFGKLNFKEKRVKTKIKNNDILQNNNDEQ
tara:strand:+ start:32523 stop:35096 length:2574 start_codon:yes stop_codon:yes gene_type:complete